MEAFQKYSVYYAQGLILKTDAIPYTILVTGFLSLGTSEMYDSASFVLTGTRNNGAAPGELPC